jgi:hypothetical protein
LAADYHFNFSHPFRCYIIQRRYLVCSLLDAHSQLLPLICNEPSSAQGFGGKCFSAFLQFEDIVISAIQALMNFPLSSNKYEPLPLTTRLFVEGIVIITIKSRMNPFKDKE